MENRFDDLTKAVAEGIPRRQALRRLGSLFVLFGGALLASLAFGGTAQAGCWQGSWCARCQMCMSRGCHDGVPCPKP